MTTETKLNAGKGICLPEAQLVLRPTPEALSLGNGVDIMSSSLSAVHRYNRNAGDAGFLAIALPEMGTGIRPGPNGGLRCGTELVMIGSEAALSVLLEDPGIRRMMARAFIDPLEIDEIYVEEGETCGAWFRDRRPEKRTPAAQRRLEARRLKRKAAREGAGVEIEETPISKNPSSFNDFNGSYSAMKIGKVTTFIGMETSVWEGGEIQVSTYGLCSRATPCPLPVALANVEIMSSQAA